MATLSPITSELLERVGFPAHFPDEFQNATVLETHISVVLIGNTHVLKLKKPVNFGFVDHRELAARIRSAANEVLLNRRLADGVYLGVLPITRDSPLRLADVIENPSEMLSVSTNTIEISVLMRRLDQEQNLRAMIERNASLEGGNLEKLIEKLSTFHHSQVTKSGQSTASKRYGTLEQIKMICQENLAVLKEHARKQPLSDGGRHALEYVECYTNLFLSERAELFAERLRDGFIINGHGDLRTEHIYFETGGAVTIIDCVEFSESLRTGDVMSDLAFLRMDLDFRLQPKLAETIIEQYREALPGYFDEQLLDFYSAYRAMVRAKVEVLKGTPVRAELYLALACRYALALTPPFILVIFGMMGVGKSTLAEFLQSLSYATLIQSDRVRKDLFGRAESDRTLAFGTGKYSPEATAKTYQAMFHRTEQLIRQGQSVILDASFAQGNQRAQVRKLASALHLEDCHFVLCRLDEESTRARLEKRERSGDTWSDGRRELLERQRASFEDVTTDEQLSLVTVDMSLPIFSQATAVLECFERSRI